MGKTPTLGTCASLFYGNGVKKCLAAVLALFGLITKQWGIMNAMIPAILFVQFSHPAACARRLHDVGKSGWFQFVPFYNFYLFLQPTKESSVSI